MSHISLTQLHLPSELLGSRTSHFPPQSQASWMGVEWDGMTQTSEPLSLPENLVLWLLAWHGICYRWRLQDNQLYWNTQWHCEQYRAMQCSAVTVSSCVTTHSPGVKYKEMVCYNYSTFVITTVCLFCFIKRPALRHTLSPFLLYQTIRSPSHSCRPFLIPSPAPALHKIQHARLTNSTLCTPKLSEFSSRLGRAICGPWAASSPWMLHCSSVCRSEARQSNDPCNKSSEKYLRMRHFCLTRQKA
jgi:hypothetical protein